MSCAKRQLHHCQKGVDRALWSVAAGQRPGTWSASRGPVRNGPSTVSPRSTKLMSPSVTINLFEPLRIQLNNHPPIDESCMRRKAKALFVYLYLNRGRQISKYQILADVWPENESADA